MNTASEQVYAASDYPEGSGTGFGPSSHAGAGRISRSKGGLLGRGWRKSTWALIAWCGLIAVGCVIAFNSGHDATAQCQSIGGSIGSICQQSVDSQVGAKVDHVLKIGFLGFVVLSIVWFMTRPQD